MESRLSDGRWSAPDILPLSAVYRDLDPAFSPNGRRLYFSSRRPNGPSPADTTSLADIAGAGGKGAAGPEEVGDSPGGKKRRTNELCYLMEIPANRFRE